MGRAGDYFEDWVLKSWPLGGIDALTLTKNSGAVHEDGDLSSPHYQVETKDGYADGISFQRTWINKLMKAAKLRNRIPVMMHRTLIGDAYAIMRIEDFFGLIEELHDYRDKEREANE